MASYLVLLLMSLCATQFVAGLNVSNANGNSNNSFQSEFMTQSGVVRRTKLFYFGMTTALASYEGDGKLRRCQVFMESFEKRGQRLKGSGPFAPTKLAFKEMMDLILQCQNLDKDKAKQRPVTAADSYTPWTMFGGIIPGTKWCGVGDIAERWDDLGVKEDLDRCCRTHDHCPVRIHAFHSGFDLINLSLYTKSHCDCDARFHSCLHAMNSTDAHIIGNVFFDIVRVECISEDYPKKCTKKGGLDCRSWIPDLSKPKKYKFTNVNMRWR